MTQDSGRQTSAWPELDGLLTRAWSPGVLQDALQIIAEGVTEVVGFGVSTIGVLRETGEIETVAVAGNEDAQAELLGTFRGLDSLLGDIAISDDWGGNLLFVPHERVDLNERDLGWIPDLEPRSHPDAWHPLDLLFAPLHDEAGDLRGVLCVDLPADGLRPAADQRRQLVRYVVQCARAVDALLERERLSERVRLADAARGIVRMASAQLSFDRILSESQKELVSAFGAQGMWIQALDDFGRGRAGIYSGSGVEVVLEDDLEELAVSAARACWRSQEVAIISRRRAKNPVVTDAQHTHILDFLAGLGLTSILFVPLGAGPECLGNLVLTRSDSDPEWSDVETSVALELGQDLGRALLNARLFERESRLLEEMRALEGYKSQLVATVSHELKNPLTGILGHLELLEDAEVSAGVERSLSAIGRNSRRIRSLVEDLLVLARAGDPERPMVASAVDLAALASDAVEQCALQAADRGLTVVVESPGEPVLTSGDHGELERVCVNLVSNAVKYSRSDGTVTIAVTDGPDGVVTLTCTDEGIGISEADQAMLFSEFFRSEDPAVTAQPGTGLGLAIVRRIVDRHGGTIAVRSTHGRGSTFTVTLPAA